MPELQDPICFTCGMKTGAAALLNRMSNGQVCPACRERLLDSIPSALPAAHPHEPSVAAEESDESKVHIMRAPLRRDDAQPNGWKPGA